MIRGNEKFITQLYFLFDIIIIFLSFLFIWWLKFNSPILDENVGHLPFQTYFIWIIPYIICAILCSWIFDLNGLKRKRTYFYEIYKVIQVHIISLVSLLSVLFIFEMNDISRSFLLYFLISNIAFISFYRISIKTILTELRRKGYNKQFILILGAGTVGRKYYDNIIDRPEYGFEVLGFLDDYQRKHRPRFKHYKPILGKVDELESIINNSTVDEIVVALPLSAHQKYNEIVYLCEKSGVRVSIVPDFHELLPAKPSIEAVGDMAVINIRNIPLDQLSNQLLKRVFDVVFALVAIILVSPLMLVISLLINFTSPGPIIFKQERIGMNKRTFIMYKFRTMKNVEPHQEYNKWTKHTDSRRTRLGTFLRATSLDELPQFINVLKGDMSVVGPRPERPYFVNQFKEDIPNYMIKHHVRPGITGWAQVNGYRGDTSITKRIKHDLFYIENWTFSLDLKIVIKTAVKGLINKNAY